VCDPKKERFVAALAAKAWKGLPERDREVLKEVFPVGVRACVARRYPLERSGMLGEETAEAFIQAFACCHRSGSALSDHFSAHIGMVWLGRKSLQPECRTQRVTPDAISWRLHSIGFFRCAGVQSRHASPGFRPAVGSTH
jgi:hypothetical protein